MSINPALGLREDRATNAKTMRKFWIAFAVVSALQVWGFIFCVSKDNWAAAYNIAVCTFLLNTLLKVFSVSLEIRAMRDYWRRMWSREFEAALNKEGGI